MRHSPSSIPIFSLVSFVAIAILPGCSPRYEARVYDAPKTESEFVKPPPALAAPRRTPPMMGSSAIPLQARRILGSVIPYDNIAYFLKATDLTERLETVELDFRNVVERFAIDSKNREIKFDLPEGWTLNWREENEFNVIADLTAKTESGEPIKFTITELAKPADLAAWDMYLLGNINRWRGQLQLPETDAATIQKELPTIQRDGYALPAYIFDATGAGAKNISTPAAPSTPAVPSSQTTSESPLKLAYEKPDSWELQPAKMFRLATFKIASDDRACEIVVSLAKDSPIQNAQMWYEQVMQSEDKSVIEPLAAKSVKDAEEIQAGTRSGKLYSIRSSDEATAPVLVVAAIPTGENDLCLFVKLKSDLRTSEEQKTNLLSFVNSLRWE